MQTNQQFEKNDREIIVAIHEESREIEIMIAKVGNDPIYKEVEQSIRLKYTDAQKVFKALKGIFE